MASEESPTISIHVQASTGKKVSIDVTGPQTIAELKAKLAQEHEVVSVLFYLAGQRFLGRPWGRALTSAMTLFSGRSMFHAVCRNRRASGSFSKAK